MTTSPNCYLDVLPVESEVADKVAGKAFGRPLADVLVKSSRGAALMKWINEEEAYPGLGASDSSPEKAPASS